MRERDRQADRETERDREIERDFLKVKTGKNGRNNEHSYKRRLINRLI